MQLTKCNQISLALCMAVVLSVRLAVGASQKHDLSEKEVKAKAEAGDGDSLALLSEWSAQGQHGMSRSMEKALHYAKLSAEKQNPFGQFYLASHYAGMPGKQGESSELMNTAADGFKKMASKGNPKAQYHLSMMYMGGIGVTNDPAKAAQLLRESAESGYRKAEMTLASMHLEGGSDNPHIKKDFDEAIKWFKMAEAFESIGHEYQSRTTDGRIPMKEGYTEAITWYKKALKHPAEGDLAILKLKLSIRRCEVYIVNPDNPDDALYRDPEWSRLAQEIQQVGMKEMMQQMMKEDAEQSLSP